MPTRNQSSWHSVLDFPAFRTVVEATQSTVFCLSGINRFLHINRSQILPGTYFMLKQKSVICLELRSNWLSCVFPAESGGSKAVALPVLKSEQMRLGQGSELAYGGGASGAAHRGEGLGVCLPDVSLQTLLRDPILAKTQWRQQQLTLASGGQQGRRPGQSRVLW